MNIRDTICAIATPPGQGGIGIVRISGPDARAVLEKIWKGRREVLSFESHRMYLGKISSPPPSPSPIKGEGMAEFPSPLACPEWSRRAGEGEGGGYIDTVLAVWMKAPNSYTGEDVVEISCHGGHVILGGILNACRKAGARLAEPGEFTKTAFLNGKMDLAQAEGVADLISATSEAASRCAKDQLEGKLSGHIGQLMDALTKLRSFVEASIDFPEEDIEFIEQEGIVNRLADITARIRALSDTYNEGRLIHDGVNVAIIGKPNVGKSSLFNALVGHERAIVHHTSGTTRDLVKEEIQIEGIAFHLTDGAGIREGEHEVERLGIEKTRDAIGRADLILFVLDGSQPADEDDKEIYKTLDMKRTVVCVNKGDLKSCHSCESRNPVDVLDPRFRGDDKQSGGVLISALRGDGIESLKTLLIQKVTAHKDMKTESVIVTSVRHKEALDAAINHLEDAINAANGKESTEFIAHHLALAQDSMGLITGKVSNEEILHSIFSRFCIGK